MNKGKVYWTARNALSRYERRCAAPGYYDMLNQILDTAYATGHWEVWFEVFLHQPQMLQHLKHRCIQAHNDNTK